MIICWYNELLNSTSLVTNSMLLELVCMVLLLTLVYRHKVCHDQTGEFATGCYCAFGVVHDARTPTTLRVCWQPCYMTRQHKSYLPQWLFMLFADGWRLLKHWHKDPVSVDELQARVECQWGVLRCSNGHGRICTWTYTKSAALRGHFCMVHSLAWTLYWPRSHSRPRLNTTRTLYKA